MPRLVFGTRACGLSQFMFNQIVPEMSKRQSKENNTKNETRVTVVLLTFFMPGIVTSSTAGKRAIPLCLPNNLKWNSENCDCISTKEQRSSLYVVEEALEKLRKVKGTNCFLLHCLNYESRGICSMKRLQ